MLKTGIDILRDEGLAVFLSKSTRFGYERIRSPHRSASLVNSWYHSAGQDFNEGGIGVFDQDWDNLLFLDACRYDYFSNSVEEYDLDGSLESRTSKASCTNGWLKANFQSKDLTDVVYVTSGSNLYQLTVNDQINPNLYKVVDVWRDDIDPKSNTVLPERMNERAIEAVEEYPNKRLVVRYMQPHTPFLGSTGARIESEDNNFTWDNKVDGRTEVDDQTIRKAYQETLDRGLEAIETVVDDLPGKTVVTADHGQLLGDKVGPIPISDWGHPSNLYVNKLIEVPWYVLPHDSRRKITKGESESYPTEQQEKIGKRAEQHLKNLGYM